jgi:vacuolar-type H+-ATPase subunit I/STV1
MNAPGRKSWVRVAILVGAVYFVIGFVFSALDPSVSDQLRFIWRLAAWIVSAAVYAAHIGYEHFRLGNSARAIALHAATAVAVGAFLLAVAATVHKSMGVSHAPYWRFLLALVVWPIITALPAFLVALVAAAVLARLPTKRLVD